MKIPNRTIKKNQKNIDNTTAYINKSQKDNQQQNGTEKT